MLPSAPRGRGGCYTAGSDPESTWNFHGRRRSACTLLCREPPRKVAASVLTDHPEPAAGCIAVLPGLCACYCNASGSTRATSNFGAAPAPPTPPHGVMDGLFKVRDEYWCTGGHTESGSLRVSQAACRDTSRSARMHGVPGDAMTSLYLQLLGPVADLERNPVQPDPAIYRGPTTIGSHPILYANNKVPAALKNILSSAAPSVPPRAKQQQSHTSRPDNTSPFASGVLSAISQQQREPQSSRAIMFPWQHAVCLCRPRARLLRPQLALHRRPSSPEERCCLHPLDFIEVQIPHSVMPLPARHGLGGPWPMRLALYMHECPVPDDPGSFLQTAWSLIQLVKREKA